MFQILDTIVIILFVLFMVYIFRGYHLTRLDRDRTQPPRSSSEESDGNTPTVSDKDEGN